MRNLYRCGILLSGCVIFGISFSQFGRGGGTWNTAGADAQRTSWARTDSRISATSMPKFQFLWKVKADNAARATIRCRRPSWSIATSAIADSAPMHSSAERRTRPWNRYGLGRVEWLQNFGAASAARLVCPGALTSGVTRPTPLAPARHPQAVRVVAVAHRERRVE